VKFVERLLADDGRGGGHGPRFGLETIGISTDCALELLTSPAISRMRAFSNVLPLWFCMVIHPTRSSEFMLEFLAPSETTRL